MTEMDILHPDQPFEHTDIFIITDENNVHDFVSIDDTHIDLSDAVMIDMSQDEFFDISFDIHHDSDTFISLDNDVIVSGFTDEDFNATIIDVDHLDDIHIV